MSLFLRLMLAFLFLAWTPLGLSVWVLTDRMEASFAATFDRRQTEIYETVVDRFRRVGDGLDRTMAAMEEDSALERELFEALRYDAFYGEEEAHQARRRRVRQAATRLVQASNLDTLRLVDLARDGAVIAMGHRRGIEAADTLVLALSARDGLGGIFARQERIDRVDLGTAEPVWTLQVVRRVGERVALVGGRVLDDTLLVNLLGQGAHGVAVGLFGPGGVRVAATYEGAGPPGDSADALAVGEMALPTAQAELEGLTLRVFMSRSWEQATIAELWTMALGLGGLGALLALFAAMAISRRLSRPLEELARAANAVAEGEREGTVVELEGRDEVAELTRAFNRMTRDLVASEDRLRRTERIAAWREIARRIAHEIKNPLFPIQMSIENLQKARAQRHPDFDEIFEESAGTILEEVARMTRIVTEFSHFARLPAPEPRATDLASLARQINQLHGEVASGVALEVEAPERLMALVDPDQIRQVLTNLLKNAIEALATHPEPEGGRRVRTRVEADTDEVRVIVEDNGPGMDDATRAEIFTPYFTTKATGTGLGLAIAQRIAEEHGGRLEAVSGVMEGSCLVLTLPASDPGGSV